MLPSGGVLSAETTAGVGFQRRCLEVRLTQADPTARRPLAGAVGTLYSIWSKRAFFGGLAVLCGVNAALLFAVGPTLQRAAQPPREGDTRGLMIDSPSSSSSPEPPEPWDGAAGGAVAEPGDPLPRKHTSSARCGESAGGLGVELTRRPGVSRSMHA